MLFRRPHSFPYYVLDTIPLPRQVNAQIQINNSSRKQVKNIKAQIVQHCEVTMVNKHFTRVVAEMETREGCPITPGASLSKTFHLTPMAKNSKDRGVALDGQLKVGGMRHSVVFKFA